MVFYTESGKGLPVILLHGFCETHEIWTQFQEKLSATFRIISPDLPGFGKSPLPARTLSIESVADQIYEDLILKLDIKECVVIGHSLGGYITLVLAEKYPHILKGIGLFHSSAFADSDEKKVNRNKTIEFVEKNGSLPFIQTLIPSLFNEARKEEFQSTIEKILKIAQPTPKETVVQYLGAMRDRKDTIHVLKNFSKPLLFIAGEHDTAIPIDKSKEQAYLSPKHDVHILPYSGHMGMYEQKEETLKIVEKFLNKV